jgi:hypothetical protein
LANIPRHGTHKARDDIAHGDTKPVNTLEDVIEELVGEIRDAAHAEEGLLLASMVTAQPRSGW